VATQAERRATTRAAIIDAAFVAVERHGSPDVPLEENAQAAGVTKGTIHYHYTNRAGLLAALTLRLFGEIEDRATISNAQHGVDAESYIRAILVEQAAPVGRVLFTVGDELLRIGSLESVDPYRYLCSKLEELGVAGQPIVLAGAVLQFGRQLAFGLADPSEIETMIAALDL
jgi:AcrR family transcriptional regulator